VPLNEYDEIIQSGHVPEGNEYDQLLQQDTTQKQQRDAAKFVASKRDPERWAKVLDISKRTKLPAEVVDRNFDKISEEDHRQRAGSEYDRLISDTPGLSKWLENPDNATLGRDEIAALARVDRGSRLVQPKDESGIDWAPTIGYHELEASAGTFAAIYGMGDPQRIASEVAASNKRAKELRDQQPNYVAEFQTAMGEHGRDVNKAVHAFLASQEDNGRSEIRKALDSFRTAGRTIGETLSMIGGAAKRPQGLAYQILEGFPSSVPLLTGTVVGAAVGNVPGLIGGALIGGMLPSVGAELNGELEKHGIDITDPESLARAYSDPALMAALKQRAARKGVTVSMVNALLAPLGGKFLEQAEKAGAGAIGKAAATAADVSVQAGGMGGGEVAGQKAAGEEVDVGAALQSAIATLGYAFGQEGIGAARRGLFHGDPAKAAVQATEQANEALRATRDAQALSEIGTAVSEAKTTQSVPESMKALVEMATGNDENAQVYFQTKDWDEHFQAAGGSPAKAIEDITGDSKPYYDAKATGSPIAIPLSDYVARVAPTEHWGKLLPFARTKPDGMSLHEASEYLKSLPATMQEIATEVSGQVARAEPTAPEVSAQKVREKVETQLKEAGVSPSVAKAQSTLYEAAFRTLGERSGVDPLELFDRYNLRVISENAVKPSKEAPAAKPLTPEEVAARTELQAKAENAIERDALSRPDPYLAKASERDFKSKTDAGEFVYARTPGNSLRTDLSKVSVEGLIDEYSRLVKANAEDQNKVVPTVVPDENFHTFNDGRAYVGMKGEAVNAKGRIVQREKSIAKLEAALKAKGVENLGELLKESFDLFQSAAPGAEGDPVKSDALTRYQDIAKQIMALPEERRQMLIRALKAQPEILELYQSAANVADLTESSAFKKWFKGSKVVNDDGTPTVLYHQTSAANVPGIEREGFDLNRPVARASDEQVPDGIFLKPDKSDIGVGDHVQDNIAQIPLFAKIENPLIVRDRAELARLFGQDETYAELAREVDRVDREVARRFDVVWDDRREARLGDTEEVFQAKDAELRQILDEGREAINAAAAKARARMTELLREEGHDAKATRPSRASSTSSSPAASRRTSWKARRRRSALGDAFYRFKTDLADRHLPPAAEPGRRAHAGSAEGLRSPAGDRRPDRGEPRRRRRSSPYSMILRRSA
jgi:hypothetical protein